MRGVGVMVFGVGFWTVLAYGYIAEWLNAYLEMVLRAEERTLLRRASEESIVSVYGGACSVRV